MLDLHLQNEGAFDYSIVHSPYTTSFSPMEVIRSASSVGVGAISAVLRVMAAIYKRLAV